MYLLFLEFSKQSAASLGKKGFRGHLLERVTGGGGGATLFISHFSKLLSILSGISEMFYQLKVPFSNFVLSRLQFFHLFDLWPLSEVSGPL